MRAREAQCPGKNMAISHEEVLSKMPTERKQVKIIMMIRKQGEWPTNRQTSVSATEIHSSEKDYLYL